MVMQSKQLFSLGQVVATPGALEALEKAEQAPSDFSIGMFTATGAMCARKMPKPTSSLSRMAVAC